MVLGVEWNACGSAILLSIPGYCLILQEGFDPDFAADKVGYALRAAMLQHFIRLGISGRFSRGPVAAKRDWGAEPGRYLSLCFARPTLSEGTTSPATKLASESKEMASRSSAFAGVECVVLGKGAHLCSKCF